MGPPSSLTVRARAADDAQALAIARKQFSGIAGLVAERLRLALALPADLDGAATVLALHPAFLPRPYAALEVELTDRLVIRVGRGADAVADGAWPALLDAEHLEPLDALLRGVDPRFRADPLDDGLDGLTVEVVIDDEPAREADEVALTRFSTGADFAFADRGTPVALRPI